MTGSSMGCRDPASSQDPEVAITDFEQEAAVGARFHQLELPF